MEIMVKRRFLGDKYTIGSLFVNGERFRVDGKAVDTLEDKNRDANMNGRFDDGERKMYGQTCIPFGKYEVGLDFSPKFSKKPSYTAFIRKGKMPHIRNVPSFEGIFDSRRQYARRHIGMPFGWFQHHQGRFDPIVARVQTVVCRNRCGNGQRRKGNN